VSTKKIVCGAQVVLTHCSRHREVKSATIGARCRYIYGLAGVSQSLLDLCLVQRLDSRGVRLRYGNRLMEARVPAGTWPPAAGRPA